VTVEFVVCEELDMDVASLDNRNMILNGVRRHNHCITQGNFKATCFDYILAILRAILSIVSQDAMHALGSHRVYIHGIHQIKSFVSKGVTCKLCLQEWGT